MSRKIISAKEFDICVSMSDLVTWEGDDKTPNVDLQAVFAALEIPVNIMELYESYFAHLYNGYGDVHVYHAQNNGGSILAIDLYRELTDQQDLTALSLRIESPAFDQVLAHLRSFFDSATRQVAFEQVSYSRRLREMLDESRYPRQVEEDHDYMQQHFVHR
ncbi:hypothetical protein [Pseudomonas vanderleydeniana]|uniref:Uncharacterized protein n=1 Tax=Pseudomonas vanderleydeniana TaxID=2745495 RepID=A0A9E6PHC5_9PSED|nr:hypothetical protein [Pseudomonas vanderleydeniana]QXI26420.1 hypothetical protein HU752_021065 [Pseudomonas vanderleydeniana]